MRLVPFTLLLLPLLVASPSALAQEDGDNYPPIEEPWRCLEDPDAKAAAGSSWLEEARGDLQREEGGARQDEECEEVTDEICEEPIRYPMPCETSAAFYTLINLKTL